jgi:hypothetical protein
LARRVPADGGVGIRTMKRLEVPLGPVTALEYWIPAERLEQFNSKIIGKIELISTHRPENL